MCAPSFLVCARLMACVRAHTLHILEGTLVVSDVTLSDVIFLLRVTFQQLFVLSRILFPLLPAAHQPMQLFAKVTSSAMNDTAIRNGTELHVTDAYDLSRLVFKELIGYPFKLFTSMLFEYAVWVCCVSMLCENVVWVLNCIVYRYLHIAYHGVSQTEALTVHFSSRKKVRLKAGERCKKGNRENKNVWICCVMSMLFEYAVWVCCLSMLFE